MERYFSTGVRIGVPVQVHRMTRQTDTAPHGHPFHELVVIVNGRGRHVTDTEDYPISKGDVFLVRPGTPHAYQNTKDLELINILYYPDLLSLPDLDLRGIPGYHALFELEPALRRQHGFKSRLILPPDQTDHVDALVRLMEHEQTAGTPGSEHMCAAYFMQLKGYIARCYTDSGPANVSAVYRMGEVISYIQTQYHQPVTLQDLAGRASMSVSTLTRMFQRTLGTSPMDYLIRVRIDRARELLRTSDMSVTDIAFTVGFTDSNYFSRMFKKHTRTSPLVYKKQR